KTSPSQSTSATLIDDIASWVMASTLGSTPFEEIFSGSCERLFAAGVPVSRGHIAYGVLHPLYSAMTYTWNRGGGLEIAGHSHVGQNEPENPEWLYSPIYHLIHKRLPFLRRRLTGADAIIDFP